VSQKQRLQPSQAPFLASSGRHGPPSSQQKLDNPNMPESRDPASAVSELFLVCVADKQEDPWCGFWSHFQMLSDSYLFFFWLNRFCRTHNSTRAWVYTMTVLQAKLKTSVLLLSNDKALKEHKRCNDFQQKTSAKVWNQICLLKNKKPRTPKPLASFTTQLLWVYFSRLLRESIKGVLIFFIFLYTNVRGDRWFDVQIYYFFEFLRPLR
jgi:hypothetical protein